MPDTVADLISGLVLLASGAVAWARRPGSRSGPLLVLAGAMWFAGDLSEALLFAHRGPVAHVLLAYPGGRLQSRTAGVVVAAAYVDGFVPELARAEWPTIVLALAVVAVAAQRLRSAGGVERRARASALAGSVAVWGVLAMAAIARLAGAAADAAAGWAYAAVLALTAAGLTADLLWGRSTEAAVTGLVVDLGREGEPQALRGALARTLGDPGLELGYRVGDGWVDEAGRALVLPAGGARVVMFVHEEGAPVAALVHDRAALEDADLVGPVEAAVRLAVANVRMQAEVEARVQDLAASRRRLVEAGDDERRRLGDELARGAEARLGAVSERLAGLAAERDGEAGTALSALSGDVGDARAELRRFAQGIHPRALTEGGLRAALQELAGHAAVPVRVHAMDRRFAAAQEVAAYFVCSEALANAEKHAGASRVDIALGGAGGELVVRVADDGKGGAEPAAGTGLRGLADRVEALGGRLWIDSPRGAGTRLEARLPGAGP
jgi:signal transduction histidine kinase